MVDSVAVSTLKPAPWNPRLIKDRRFQQLCQSLVSDPDFLEQRPILATADGTVYAGNMRLRAALHLGWPTVPAILSDIPDQLAKERAVRDNNGFGEWAEDDLSQLLEELSQSGTDLSTLGFTDSALDQLVGGPPVVDDPGAQMDRADELREQWGTERGQLWTIGKHRLLCGDSTNADDVARLMDGERAEMVFTDPPYGVSYEGGRNPESNIPRSGLAGDESADLYVRCLMTTQSHLLASAPMYIWFADSMGNAVYDAISAIGYAVRALIVWNKLDPHYGNFMAQYMNKHEPCLYCVNKPPPWNGPTNETTVWDEKQPSQNEYHPTQKPIALALRALTNSSNRAAIVADWFIGSGTTMVAAEQLGRICYGMEIEPKYVAVTLQRMADMGLEPVLDEAL